MPRLPSAPKREPAVLTYTLADAARISSLSLATLRRRAEDGSLRMVKVGGRRLVDAASLRAMLGVG